MNVKSAALIFAAVISKILFTLTFSKGIHKNNTTNVIDVQILYSKHNHIKITIRKIEDDFKFNVSWSKELKISKPHLLESKPSFQSYSFYELIEKNPVNYILIPKFPNTLPVIRPGLNYTINLLTKEMKIIDSANFSVPECIEEYICNCDLFKYIPQVNGQLTHIIGHVFHFTWAQNDNGSISDANEIDDFFCSSYGIECYHTNNTKFVIIDATEEANINNTQIHLINKYGCEIIINPKYYGQMEDMKISLNYIYNKTLNIFQFVLFRNSHQSSNIGPFEVLLQCDQKSSNCTQPEITAVMNQNATQLCIPDVNSSFIVSPNSVYDISITDRYGFVHFASKYQIVTVNGGNIQDHYSSKVKKRC